MAGILGMRSRAAHVARTALRPPVRSSVRWLVAPSRSLRCSSEDGGGRAMMTEYWNKDHGAPTIENMMLDSNAGQMDALERPEILSKLPSLQGKRVLELGAGIGRFSGILAQKADSVVAVDFVDASSEVNRRENADKKNLEVLTADVTTLQMEPGSFDLIFTNWLLMYFSDAEVEAFANKVLKWLRPGGILFFRESCFHASGNTARRFNPTQYRDPETYSQMFSDAMMPDGSRFQLQATNCVESYAKMKGNMFQMWFRWEKLSSSASEHLRRSLAIGQHGGAKAFRYEKIYGRGYIYTGGDVVTQQMLDTCKDWLVPGARCMDFGAGLGGTAFYIADTVPGIYIHGVNINGGMGGLVAGRHLGSTPAIRDRLTFDIQPECGVPEHELRYAPNSFDVVFVRETMMYLENQDKAVVLQKINRLLRPGGRLVVVDYCMAKAQEDLSGDFASYLKTWGYFLNQPKDQEQLLGRFFPQVETIDKTSEFVGFMDEGLKTIEETFGPNHSDLLARQAASGRDALEAAREPMEDAVTKILPSVPALIAGEAVNAALEKLSLHVAAAEADIERCKTDYALVKDIWQFERKASSEGDLKWCFFIATKEA